ncbi:disease resistance protein [Arabidopsis thaliana]|jgi:disease resistance protein RPS2|uniref:Probable disease resistance protein At5g43740 n=2 Tax=Arabidopsis thaliana TaxID=3702 RepID=DRL33_ARATH|nr:Disease resistance protein (CC-NBS-LRR class) family [Arabidopsis thaliana]NP_851126.1 Disease resistance protein (CC-NBS-LRR class) family [Arabidopsis thaliana]Q9FG90.1 RecName: Full=Probable disease resistance protein At5g43740 [Arabidopsis thaliana]AAK91398.1 AT5g43740/MQD19_7 [Arabidopsis thaliana]AAN18060.1 At5g43740/MQD19_7 [Arabidopsis thaliana]AED95002.1 Disease resistance protein (CC-NBS-LRR class) family [Arabidopsis thaliana]AED95003.1 Disease resistance protein (CC-NBS-LRR cla|eukprot:NP_199187.1 Disease resistance protein (CC-NBS-LRR class) family [Arabidopsis thaliana]
MLGWLVIPWNQIFTAACGCFLSDRNYIHMMESNLDALQKTMEELKNGRDDLLGRVSIEEDKGLQRLAQVNGWLSRVQIVESEFKDLLEAMSIETGRLCLLGYCSEDCISSYNYGEKVSKMLEEVKELLSKKDFRMVAQEIIHKVEKKLIQTTVGLDKLVEMAWSSLMNDEIGTLGLYGMGGVGKTTLLESLNNKFVELESEFDVVIWVVVSKDFQFEGIQDQILGRLRSDKEWERETESKKASLIYNNLERKKFVLLLDDLWSEVDMTKIGVPPPTRENGSKIVFTTRSTEVCKHMKADKQIKVACLSPDEAWELFRLTVGDIILRSHQDIPALARIVAAKCHGLPLALNVIGKAMSCKETIQEWSHAINVLNSAGHEFPGMEERILPILKFSYDSLKNGEIKLCFLYCSLFPEDSEIPKEKWIEYWICEGFINPNRYEDGGTNHGYDIIGLLVRAHLLIECELTDNVKMHDVIREMALWINSDFGKQQETICVKSGAHVRMIPNDINWEIVRTMSFTCTQIKKISCRSKCPNLSTLLILDNRLLVKISNRFFRFMPKLVVLDLSANLDLIKLPEEISNLGSLQYLNISLTGIKSLPVGLKKLRKLIYLNLEFTGVHGSLVGIAATLPNLQVLKFFYSCVYVDDILMKELQDLEHLKILTANVKDVTILERIQGDDRLASSIRSLCLEDMSTPRVILSTIALGGLQQLAILMCNISEIRIDWESKERRELSPTEILPSTGSPGFKQLSTVYINQLEGQRDLSWLLYAQNLKKLEVCWSPQIEEIINKEKGMNITKLHRDIVVPFGNLEDLALRQMADLTEICWNYRTLPNLRKSYINDCPKLPEDIFVPLLPEKSPSRFFFF